MTSRQGDLTRFYAILDDLAAVIGEVQLADCCKEMAPTHGVYFFQEHGEERADSGSGARVVRVGTHGIQARKTGARNTRKRILWDRLSDHLGTRAGGGHHRSSVFRELVGSALIKREGIDCPTWKGESAKGKSAPPKIVDKDKERLLEERVTDVIGNMPVLWLAVTDASRRKCIERNAIALLSNYRKKPLLDARSPNWLGLKCRNDKVPGSGLWNRQHVDKPYDPKFLKEMEELAAQMGAS